VPELGEGSGEKGEGIMNYESGSMENYQLGESPKICFQAPKEDIPWR
jgi:hypothetical protein